MQTSQWHIYKQFVLKDTGEMQRQDVTVLYFKLVMWQRELSFDFASDPFSIYLFKENLAADFVTKM